MKSWQKIVFSLFCVVAVIYFLMMGIRIYIEKKIMSRLGTEGKIQYEDWRTRKLSFAPEDLEANPFQEKTIQAAGRFYKIWEEKKQEAVNLDGKYKMYKTKISGQKEMDQIPPAMETPTTTTKSQANQRAYNNIEDFYKDLPQFEALIAAFVEMVKQPDYEIDAVTSDSDPWMISNTGRQDYLLSLQIMSKMLQIKTSELVAEGKTPEAFAAAESIVRASKTHPFSVLIHRLIGISILSIGSSSWHQAVDHCSDGNLLRDTLKLQISLKPQKEMISDNVHLGVTDSIGQIRSAKRRGIETNIQGMTGKQISGEAMRVEAECLEKFTLPKLTDQTQKDNIQRMIKDFRTSASLFGGKPQNALGYGAKAISGIVTPVLFGIARPNFSEAVTREKVSLARFDLLILSTAWKIYTLEHNAEPEKPEALAPDLLPEIPRDPFAQDGRPYASKPRLYSVGPDGTDQEGDILYDPTNGAMSSGDIFYQEE